MRYLDKSLISYSKTDVYPFHMPGHKRRELSFPNPYTIDITEIDGFDNLHHAEGIIEEAQERAAVLYGSQRCYFLVNGSTCGLLAAICAATKKGDRVLVARNCHKAVYHAMFLQELHAEYLYPVITGSGLQGQITSVQVEATLRKNADIAAVIITSPTYEGALSDIEEIAHISHEYGVPLIVDGAHGAHLGFGGDFPESAVQQSADAVVMSLHKTLPSFTQTALLHLTSNRIAADEVERYLGVFETSSPSYLFMAGMDRCIRMLVEQGAELFARYRERLNILYREVAELEHLHVMCREDISSVDMYDWDDSKLIIFAGDLTGRDLASRLLDKYRLQMEMVSAEYVLGMTSIMDTDEGFARLSAALREIDMELARGEKISKMHSVAVGFTARTYRENVREMEIYQASSLSYREVSFTEAVGKISADYIYLYPPGIPLIVPGEVIDESFLDNIRLCLGQGLLVGGQANITAGRIKIVYF